MKYSIFVLAFFGSFLSSCSKENKPIALEMRIKNNTSSIFFYSYSAGKEFGKIATGATTAYKSFENIIEAPSAQIATGTDTLYVGSRICGSPFPPSLDAGKYTLEIFEDNNAGAVFLNARFIKN